METVKNATGKTICRVDHIRKHIEIVHKGCWSRLWFDEVGHFHECHEHGPSPERKHANT